MGAPAHLDAVAEVSVGAQRRHVVRLQLQRLPPQVLRVPPRRRLPLPRRRCPTRLAARGAIYSFFGRRGRSEERGIVAEGVTVSRVPGEGRLVEQGCPMP